MTQYFTFEEVTELIGASIQVKLGKRGDAGFPIDARGHVLALEKGPDKNQSKLLVVLVYQTRSGAKGPHEHVVDKRQFERHFRVTEKY